MSAHGASVGNGAGDLGAVHQASLVLFRAFAISDLDEAEDACRVLVLRLSQAERDLEELGGAAHSARKTHGGQRALVFRIALMAAVRELLALVRHPGAHDVIPLVPRRDWSLVVERELTEAIRGLRRERSVFSVVHQKPLSRMS